MQCRLVAFLSVLIASCWFAASGVPRTYCNSKWMTFHFAVFGWVGTWIPQGCPWKTRMPEISSFWRHFSNHFRSICIPYFPCSCPIWRSNQPPSWGLAERLSLQRKLVVDAGFGGGLSSTIIEHHVARDGAVQRKRRCPQEAALRTVLLDLELKEAELTDIRKVEGVMWYPWYLGSSDMTESNMVYIKHM